MSDFDLPSNDQGQESAVHSTLPPNRVVRDPRRFTPSPFFPLRRPALRMFLVLLAVPTAAVIIGYGGRHTHFADKPIAAIQSVTSSAFSPSAKPKPAPGKPMLPQIQLPAPRAYVPPPTAAPLPQLTPPPATGNPVQPSAAGPSPATAADAAPPVNGSSTKLENGPLVYRARHDKVFGDGCAGQLTLNSTGLVFNCSENPHDSLQIALNEIGAVDGNGFRLLSGKKYHFSIPGMTKSGEQELFLDWLHRVR